MTRQPSYVTHSDELFGEKRTILVYGQEGSGKTHFAGSFPAPYFFVPRVSYNEMQTLRDRNVPVVLFDGWEDMQMKVQQFVSDLRSGIIKDCATVVFDNLTSAQIFVEKEIRESIAGRSENMRERDWGKLAQIFINLMIELHSLDVMVVWIAHQLRREVKSSPEARESYTKGEIDLVGKSGRVIPRHADWILHLENEDWGNEGLRFFAFTKPHDIWNARIRGPKESTMEIPTRVKNPTYNKFAKVMGWPSRKEVESGLGKVRKSRTKKKKKSKKS